MLARRHPQVEDQHYGSSEGGDWWLLLVSVHPGGESLATVSHSPGMSLVLKWTACTVEIRWPRAHVKVQ